MNNLMTQSWVSPISASFKKLDKDLEMGASLSPGMDMTAFKASVESINTDIKTAQQVLSQVEQTNEKCNGAVRADEIEQLQGYIHEDLAAIGSRARDIKEKLENLQKENLENRRHPGCGKNSATDQQRQNMHMSLGKKLKAFTEDFLSVRHKLDQENRTTVERRLYTVTGQKPTESELNTFIDTGGRSEDIMRVAVQRQGARDAVMTTISELQERQEDVNKLTKGLMELHQVFMDMATLVEAQGETLNNIEEQVGKTFDYQHVAVKDMQVAREYQKNTRKWKMWVGIGAASIIVVIILIIIISFHKHFGF